MTPGPALAAEGAPALAEGRRDELRRLKGKRAPRRAARPKEAAHGESHLHGRLCARAFALVWPPRVPVRLPAPAAITFREQARGQAVPRGARKPLRRI